MQKRTCYHPDPEIDAGVREAAAEGARYDLSVGMRCHCCPVCGWEHNRGWIDGDIYRCLNCGEMSSPARGGGCDQA
jgi:hypothetical protein